MAGLFEAWPIFSFNAPFTSCALPVTRSFVLCFIVVLLRAKESNFVAELAGDRSAHRGLHANGLCDASTAKEMYNKRNNRDDEQKVNGAASYLESKPPDRPYGQQQKKHHQEEQISDRAH